LAKPSLQLLDIQTAADGCSLSAVLLVSPSGLRVSAKLARALLAERPTLAEHACHACGVRPFCEVIVGTTLSHLAEHLAIDLLVAHYPGQRFSGTTTWEDDEAGTMRVRVRALDGAPSAREVSGGGLQGTTNLELKASLEEAVYRALVLINNTLC
jgi:hypothetical protein